MPVVDATRLSARIYPTRVGTDGEYPVIQVRMQMQPGETSTIEFTMTPPDDSFERSLTGYVTPLFNPTEVTSYEFGC